MLRPHKRPAEDDLPVKRDAPLLSPWIRNRQPLFGESVSKDFDPFDFDTPPQRPRRSRPATFDLPPPAQLPGDEQKQSRVDAFVDAIQTKHLDWSMYYGWLQAARVTAGPGPHPQRRLMSKNRMRMARHFLRVFLYPGEGLQPLRLDKISFNMEYLDDPRTLTMPYP